MKSPAGHVHLVDDDSDVRHYVGDLLRQLGYGVTTYEDAERFLAAPPDQAPAVVLMDMRMAGATGVQAQRRLREMGLQTPVVFISGESQPREIIDAMKDGAVDFLIKPFRREEVVAAVDKALALDRQRCERLQRLRQVQGMFRTLTEREKEVFHLVVQGHTNIAIGELTGIQAGTVKKHRATIYAKFGLDTVAELIKLCEGLEL